jgi:hypothetical protein
MLPVMRATALQYGLGILGEISVPYPAVNCEAIRFDAGNRLQGWRN